MSTADPITNIQNDDFLGAEVVVEERSFGSAYPIVQYVNGDQGKKSLGDDDIAFTGGFFISAEAGIEVPGAVEYVLHTRKGNEVPGFAIRDLVLTPIRYRRCWEATPDEGLSRRYGWDEYDEAMAFGKVRGKAQILVSIVGVDEPVLLTFSGFGAKALLSMGNDTRGILPTYANKVVGVANRLRSKAATGAKPKALPLCAFGLTVGPDRDAKGKPNFTEVGKGETSMITLPTWVDEPAGLLDAGGLKRLFVGNERLGTLQEVHAQADDWVMAYSSEQLAIQAGRQQLALSGAPANGAGPAIAGATGVPGENQMAF